MSSEPPELTPILGETRGLWDTLCTFLHEFDGVTSEWKFYGEKHGWQLKVTAKRRALLYLIPRPDHFTAAMALREPTIAALRERGIPEPLVREIEAAKTSPEGKPARVEVRGPRDLGIVKQLVAIKLATA